MSKFDAPSLPSIGAVSEWNGALVILFRSAKLQERVDEMFIQVYNDYRYLLPLQEAIYLFYTCFSPLAKNKFKESMDERFIELRKKTQQKAAYYATVKNNMPTYIPDTKLINELRELYMDCITLRQYVGAGFPVRRKWDEREGLEKLLRGGPSGNNSDGSNSKVVL